MNTIRVCHLVSPTSGTANFCVDASEKLLLVSYTDNTTTDYGYVKRIDMNSLTDHDTTGNSIDFEATVGYDIDELASVSYDKKVHNFGLSYDNNAFIYSRIDGKSIEPISVDLTNISDVDIQSEYVGIDVVKNRFKFSDGEEL